MLLLARRRTSAAQRPLFALSGCCLAVLASLPAAASEPVKFQSSFMRQIGGAASDAGAAALDSLSSNDIAPGKYQVKIDVNGMFFDRRELEFFSDAEGEVVACLSLALIKEFGVKLETLTTPVPEDTACVDLHSLIEDASVELDGSAMKLSVSVPQIYMDRSSAGYVDASQWDDGINAAFVNYQVGAQQYRNEYDGAINSQYLYLNSGLNLGAWRLRSSNAFQNDGKGRSEWTRAYTYAQRDIPGTHADLTLGETSTPGDVFRSVPILGAQVMSNMRMLPDTMQNYAPIVRGVALSRARLEIRQNGFPIYTTYVSAGPYEIDDLNTVAGSGELEIVLTEADGQVRRFTQPYSTMNNLLREGVWRYSASAGRYDTQGEGETAMIAQGTIARGMPWNSTLYGGLMGNEFYRAGSLGIAKNFGSFGALSLDVTRSSAETGSVDNRQQLDGVSYSAKYSKSFASRTNLRFAGYRYATEGYRDFIDVMRERNMDERFIGGRRSQLEASVSQSIGSRSSINLSLSQTDFWNTDQQQRQYQVNFNTSFKKVNVSLYASQSLSDTFGSDRQFGVSVSMPLEFGSAASATYDMQKHRDQLTQRASLSGSNESGLLNYRASVAESASKQKSGEFSVAYQTPPLSLGAGVAKGADYSSVSLSASGAALVHADGVVFGKYVGETSGLAHVPDVEGVGLANAGPGKTNSSGYALVPYLQPYRTNRVVLDTADLDPNVEIDNGTLQVVPRRGAIVKAEFAARRINRLLLTTRDAQGKPLPFGAQVSDGKGTVLGVVGQAGQLLLATGDGPQSLNVSWGTSSATQCRLTFDVDQLPIEQDFRVESLACQ